MAGVELCTATEERKTRRQAAFSTYPAPRTEK